MHLLVRPHSSLVLPTFCRRRRAEASSASGAGVLPGKDRAARACLGRHPERHPAADGSAGLGCSDGHCGLHVAAALPPHPRSSPAHCGCSQEGAVQPVTPRGSEAKALIASQTLHWCGLGGGGGLLNLAARLLLDLAARLLFRLGSTSFVKLGCTSPICRPMW